MLADFPDDAFCTRSLDAVATKCGNAPSYGALRSALGDWWKHHRPHSGCDRGHQPAAPNQDARRSRECRELGQDAQEIRAKITRNPATASCPICRHVTPPRSATIAPHQLGLLPPERLKYRSEPPERAALRAAAADIHAEVKRGPPE